MGTKQDEDLGSIPAKHPESGRVRTGASFPEPRQSSLIPRAEVPTASPIPRESVERALGGEATRRTDAPQLRSPGANQVTAELLTLAAETSAEMPPTVLAATYHAALGRLFPGRRVVIQLVPQGLPADTPRRPTPREGVRPVPLSRAALERHQRSIDGLNLDGIVLTNEYVPRFFADAVGIDVPLFDRKRVGGVLVMEYPPHVAALEADMAILTPFALQLAALLRSARLLTESTRLRELEEMVIQSEKLATLGELAASVVHELNNPLTSISVYGDHLLKRLRTSGAEADDVEKARRIVEASDRILSFTKDLMNYARPANTKPAPVDLCQIVDESLAFCEHLFDARGVVVTRAYGEERPQVIGVDGQLHQVFINLFTNASHAMGEDGGCLCITIRLEAQGEAVIEVADNGQGIPADRIEQVFDPFFTTKANGAGTGLGLSIVRNIVRNHEGEIVATCAHNQGAVFTLRFPTL